jgi:hypothetical protein
MNHKLWTTKEGVHLEISKMATPHLLATIHMIERNRMNNLLTIMTAENWTEEIINYYGKFPEAYKDLCEEAERRLLIHRGIQKEGIIRVRNKRSNA